MIGPGRDSLDGPSSTSPIPCKKAMALPDIAEHTHT
jgi:hypothetical protein